MKTLKLIFYLPRVPKIYINIEQINNETSSELVRFCRKKKRRKKNSSKTRTHRFIPGHTPRSLKILSTLFFPPPHRPSLLLGQPTPFIKYLLNPHPIRTSRFPPYICSPNHLDTEILLNFSEKNHKVLYWKIKKKWREVLILKCENLSLFFLYFYSR